MKEQLAQKEWGQDVPTTDPPSLRYDAAGWDKITQPRLRREFLGSSHR